MLIKPKYTHIMILITAQHNVDTTQIYTCIDNDTRDFRPPAAGIEWVIGRFRRPRRWSPRAPRGYDATPPADGRIQGRAWLKAVGVGTP